MPFTVYSEFLRLNWPKPIVSVLTVAFKMHQWDVNGMIVSNCLALISFFHSSYHFLFHSLYPLTPCSPFLSSRQWNSSESWFPGGRRGPIQHLQLPALCRSLRLRAGRWLGRESNFEQRSDSLAKRSGAHLAVQRSLWTQWDEENAGR